MNTFQTVHSTLAKLADPQKAQLLQRFFRTGKGEYGEGDQFLGITVPVQRQVAKKYKDLTKKDLEQLLASPIHEERLVALVILQLQFEAAHEEAKEQIVHFYLNHTTRINNWDLVDISADKILGKFLLKGSRKILYNLAKSKLLWERRIAIVATFALIRDRQFEDTLKICELLLNDKHDLMHKACGWMLREVGKRDKLCLTHFLDQHAAHMPRTMLRYAIEKYSPAERAGYLAQKNKVKNKQLR